MRRDDVIDLFARIPEDSHPRVQLVLRCGPPLSVDCLVRYEPTYLVMRGREAGNQDEGRAFFVPYDEIALLKLETIVKLSDMEEWFADRPAITRKTPVPTPAMIETPPPAGGANPTSRVAPTDPAEIARQNLLDRIRAARSLGGGAAGRAK